MAKRASATGGVAEVMPCTGTLGEVLAETASRQSYKAAVRKKFPASPLALLALDLLLLLLGEGLNGEGLQAVGVKHSSLCVLNQAFRYHGGQWICAINQAKRLQHILEHLAEHGNFFGPKRAMLSQQFNNRHSRSLSSRPVSLPHPSAGAHK